MPQPGFQKLIARALPGCMQELVIKSGCAESTIRRWLKRFRDADEAHISGWTRNAGAITAIYSAGKGTDVPCRLKRKTSAQYSKDWRKRAKQSGDLEFVYARRNAIERAKAAAKRPNTWLSALGVV